MTTTDPLLNHDAYRAAGLMPCPFPPRRQRQFDTATHALWIKALLHLDAALQAVDGIGDDGATVASHIENARVHAKQALRPARGGSSQSGAAGTHNRTLIVRPAGTTPGQ